MLDSTDKKILNLLLLDTKLTYQEIGKRLYVSQGTVHSRVKKMQESGIITGSRIIIEHHLLGYDIVAYIGIYLSKSSLYEVVIEELKKIPEVIEAHYTTGVYSILAKIICFDTNHLRDVLSHKIQPIKGIQRTETLISLEEGINRPIELNIQERNTTKDTKSKK